MRSLWFGALVAFLAFAGVATATAPAGGPPGNWTLLSTWTIAPGADSVTIPVGAVRGSWDKLYFAISNNALNILDVKVTYADGKEETVPVRAVIAKGAISKVLELKGTDRRINTITVTNEKITLAPAGVSMFGQGA
jgi:hypothetical protein